MSRRRRTSPLAGVSRCHPDPSCQGWGGLAQWQVRGFLCWGLIPDVAAVPGRPQCSVTLARCCDRWLSNNARFKCKPKGAFSDFFFIFFLNATSRSAWLSATSVLGPFSIRSDTFAVSPVFTRNTWLGGGAGNPQHDQAASLGLDITCPEHSTNTFLSGAVGGSLQVLCCPQVPAVRAGPAFAQSCPLALCRAPSQDRSSL